MFTVKRTLMIVVVLALALGSLGVWTASAASLTPKNQGTPAQQAGGTAWLGVGVRDTNDGVTIEEVVSGSPAETAKLSVGDVIKSVDGKTVDSASALVTLVQTYKPGDTITVTVSTNGTSRDVSVTLGTRPAEQAAPTAPNAPQQARPGYANILKFLGLDANVTADGVQINSIATGSPLADSGLQAGDLVTAINGQKVNSSTLPRDLLGVARGIMSDTSKPVTVTVTRSGTSQDIQLKIDLSKFSGLMGGMMGIGTAGQPTQLGVQFRTLTPEIAQTDKLPVSDGAQILEVFPNTPAAKAGLQKDDIITAVDGDKVDQEHTLSDRLYAYEEGDTVKLTVQRGTDSMEISVTLGPRNQFRFMMPGMGQGMPFFFGPEGGRRGQGHGFYFNMPPMGPNGGFHFHFGPGQGGNQYQGQGQQSQGQNSAPAPTPTAPSNPA